MIEQKLIKRVGATEKEREGWRKNRERERKLVTVWLLYGECASAERLVNGGFRSVNAGRLATAKL